MKARISRQAAFILFKLQELEKDEENAARAVKSPITAKWLRTFAHKLRELRLELERELPHFAEEP